jgi:hypothetical protein
MRVYRREEFLQLPPGTIYATGGQWYFGALNIKHETTDYGDWWSLDPCWIEGRGSNEYFAILDGMLEKGTSHPMQDAVTRDGIFDKDALFLVFEKDDLLKLRTMIDEAINL